MQTYAYKDARAFTETIASKYFGLSYCLNVFLLYVVIIKKTNMVFCGYIHFNRVEFIETNENIKEIVLK